MPLKTGGGFTGIQETEYMNDDIILDDDENGNGNDIALEPGTNSDSNEEILRYICADICELYDVYSYRHAAAILKNSFPTELVEIETALHQFSIEINDFAKPGGNESTIPKKLSIVLRPSGWYETRIQGDLIVKLIEHSEDIKEDGRVIKYTLPEKSPIILSKYIDGHKIDYVKGRVALDLEWNSKDQTFDRDLYAFRMFHECGIISVAAIITRSEKLNEIFNAIPLKDKEGNPTFDKNGHPKFCKQKFGASTTWMGKLLYRLNAGRHGGCPVLVFGIRPEIIADWPLTEGD